MEQSVSAPLQRAKQLLGGETSLAVVQNSEERTFDSRGIGALLDLLPQGGLRGASVADKIVGKAAALLMVRGGVKEVYAETLSESGDAVLSRYNVPHDCGTLTPAIQNREGTGPCPMEKAVENINDPGTAQAVLRARRDELADGRPSAKKLGFGCMRLPVVGGKTGQIDIGRFAGMIDTFLSRGFTYFDTAYRYHDGDSEPALRKALVERHPRDSFTVTTKMPMFMVHKREDMERIFDDQLQRLGVEYFDYYWLHALNRLEYMKVQKLDAFGFIAQKKKEGRIRHIGFSFHDTAKTLDKILADHPEAEYVQLQINYLDWNSRLVQSRACYETAMRHGVPVIVMEPVKGGALASLPPAAVQMLKNHDAAASPASWAVRFAASLPGVAYVLSGMSDEAQLDDNTSYMQNFVPLTEEENKLAFAAGAIVKGGTAVPCTGCRYCAEGCPQHIAIPEYFALLNENKHTGGGKEMYAELAKAHGKASDCIRCGKCEKICPQHIKIRSFLQKAAQTFEQP